MSFPCLHNLDGSLLSTRLVQTPWQGTQKSSQTGLCLPFLPPFLTTPYSIILLHFQLYTFLKPRSCLLAPQDNLILSYHCFFVEAIVLLGDLHQTYPYPSIHSSDITPLGSLPWLTADSLFLVMDHLKIHMIANESKTTNFLHGWDCVFIFVWSAHSRCALVDTEWVNSNTDLWNSISTIVIDIHVAYQNCPNI